MQAQNLYNKYRPTKFSDVKQTHITRLLQAQIAQKKHPSSFLFHGPSGTGKTTIARIMASALMCENVQGNEPCGECISCKTVRSDNNRDFIEINCATNGGVEEMRTLIAERMRIPPQRGDYRVFLLDECHLLSTSAQSSLLKITEEPPPHIKFFLCTTESQKVLTAIRNRCQQHSVSRVSEKDIISILQNVVKEENMQANVDAIKLIAQSSAGCVRDALVVLEQVSVVDITEENVRSILRRGPKQLSVDLLTSISTINRGRAMQLIDAAQAEGRDLAALVEESARSLMQVAKASAQRITVEDDSLVNIQKAYSGNQMVDAASKLLEINTKIRQNVPADLALQVGILNIIDRFAKMEAAKKEVVKP